MGFTYIEDLCSSGLWDLSSKKVCQFDKPSKFAKQFLYDKNEHKVHEVRCFVTFVIYFTYENSLDRQSLMEVIYNYSIVTYANSVTVIHL